MVVFDSADLDSAMEGLVQAIFFNQGQVCCAGSRLLVQESVADRFVDKIKARMKTLRVGHSLDKCLDMGAIVDGTQRDNIESFVKQGQSEGNEIFQVEVPTNVDSALFYPPTLVTNVRGVRAFNHLFHFNIHFVVGKYSNNNSLYVFQLTYS